MASIFDLGHVEGLLSNIDVIYHEYFLYLDDYANKKAKRKIDLENYTTSVLYQYKQFREEHYKDYKQLMSKGHPLLVKLYELYNTDRFKGVNKIFKISLDEYNNLTPDELTQLELKALESNKLEALIKEGNGGFDLAELEGK